MSKQIFILSSDRQMARNTASYLKLKGYSVHTFCDPQEAIVGADTTRPDLAIIELSLAGRSGIEFLYELRSYPDWQSLPVIVLGHQHLADIEPYLN
ncbi:MAG TPA: response regulator, partial [Candidatus Saccharimonadales bacterium]|nr:response regulator [Candidatus Saccharimonadales bacterium]